PALLSLHSFPTRRSSDLVSRPAAGAVMVAVGSSGLLTVPAIRSPFPTRHHVLLGSPRASSVPAPTTPERWLTGWWEQTVATAVPDRKSTRLNSSHVAISY